MIALMFIGKLESKKILNASSIVNTGKVNNSKNVEINILGEEEIAEAREVLNLKEYENMPEDIEGFKVIGKIDIPKINIEQYILDKTTTESLELGVTKVCGPEINKTGNLCIAGHNYGDTFGWISSLDVGDEVNITDTYNRKVTYKVYEIERVLPEDTSCLSQNTNREREITLITCNLGASKRVIVKAIELYD
jgi:sortase A